MLFHKKHIKQKIEKPLNSNKITECIIDNFSTFCSILNLGIQLEREKVEFAYNIKYDFIGTSPYSNLPVIIETTDNKSHEEVIGRFLAYISHRKRGILIIVTKEFTPALKNSLLWLNSVVPINVFIYGIEANVDKQLNLINNSIFEIITSPTPNKINLIVGKHYSQKNDKYMIFFSHLLDKIVSSPDGFLCPTASPQPWWRLSLGKPGFSLDANFTIHNKFRICIYIDSGNKEHNKVLFNNLFSMKTQIESSVERKLKWEIKEDGHYCIIYDEIECSINDSFIKQNKTIEWAIPIITKLKHTFEDILSSSF